MGEGKVVYLAGARVGADKAWLYAHADFFVAASIGEGFPVVVVEALASGLPVLASDIPPHCETIIPNQTGMLFKTRDAADMGDKMRQMMDMDLAPMRAAARAASAGYSAERHDRWVRAGVPASRGNSGRQSVTRFSAREEFQEVALQ